MSSATSYGKKPALCRYFASSGTCFYGNDCQFLHENPRGRKFPGLQHSPNSGNIGENSGPPVSGGDGNNGDQYFSATFNGLPDFQTFTPKRDLNNSPIAAVNPGSIVPGSVGPPLPGAGMAALPNLDGKPPLSMYANPFSSMDDSGLSDQMASLNMGGQIPKPHTAGGPPEFVPKSSTPGVVGLVAGANLTHSTSSPSFMSYSQAVMDNSLGPKDTAPPGRHLPPAGFSSAASPMDSPRLSPDNGPMGHPRDASPVPGGNATAGVNIPAVHESVGGTTYFYNQEDMSNIQSQGVVLPSFTMYPNILPHVAHMRPKANMPSFFMPDELKMEVLNRHVVLMAQIDREQNPGIPAEVDTYHNLFPMEPPPGPMHKSNTFGYHTTVYKASSTKDGLTYCLRRIHGYRLMNTKNADLWKCIDLWKKMQHSNIVQLREVFTTKAFGDHSMVFVYDFHACAETMMFRHFTNHHHHSNGFSGRRGFEGPNRPYSAKADKGGPNGPRQHAGLLPESLIWTYTVQLTSALRTIHAHGLACRVMDPTKVLMTDKSSRVRLNCVGIFDVLSFDSSQANPLAVIPHYQQEDLVSLGKVILALACNSISGIHRDRIQSSMELVARNYSSDLKHLILYLLGNQNRPRNINDVMPMIGARFYTQLDSAQLRNDVMENELSKEVENGRLFRMACKMGIINERPEFNLDPTWSETGDRYMLKLFRDYLFHQVDENGAPWIDLAHIIQCLNKLEAGVPEKIYLMSRDEQSVLVVSYLELKQCIESAFGDLIQSQNAAHEQAQQQVPYTQ